MQCARGIGQLLISGKPKTVCLWEKSIYFPIKKKIILIALNWWYCVSSFRHFFLFYFSVCTCEAQEKLWLYLIWDLKRKIWFSKRFSSYFSSYKSNEIRWRQLFNLLNSSQIFWWDHVAHSASWSEEFLKKYKRVAVNPETSARLNIPTNKIKTQWVQIQLESVGCLPWINKFRRDKWFKTIFKTNKQKHLFRVSWFKTGLLGAHTAWVAPLNVYKGHLRF